jgi:hypothetical protein
VAKIAKGTPKHNFGLKKGVSAVTSFIKDNIGIIGAGAGGIALGASVAGTTAAIVGGSKKKKRKSTNSNKRKKSYKHRRKGRYTPHTAGKGKDRSHKRIRYTKNGQPYIIMASGKARFIKKKGARRSHRTKGGRY